MDLLDELELWIDAWKEPRTELKENKYWKIEKLENKGCGMIATRNIPAHTIIVVERAILFELKTNLLSENDKSKSAAQLLLNNYNKLLINEQEIVMNLANVFDDDEKENVIEGIYDTSACQTNKSQYHKSGLFPTFARINHACIPNCTMYFKSFPAQTLIVKTLFDVEQNEEITVSYLPRFLNTYGERQNLLTQRYKFKCNCSLCCNGTKFDEKIKEYRTAIMTGDRHWNCIQTAMEILNKDFKSFPSIKTNLLSSAIECATENYMYDDAYDLIVQSIQLNIKCYGMFKHI